MNQGTKILKPLFYLTAIYSFFALTPLAEKTGGACNAGVVLIGIGLFLIICSVLIFVSINNITRTQRTTTGNRVAKVFSILALVIWGFWAGSFAVDEITFTLVHFTPFLATTIASTIFAFTSTGLQNTRRSIDTTSR
jgi:hypothetical protein